jgi:hypothetical protein
MKITQKWQVVTLIIGATVGILTGVGAAYILLQKAEREQKPPKLTAGEGVRLGLGILTVLRLVADLGGDR